MKVIIEDTEIEIDDSVVAEGDGAVVASIVPYYPEAAGAEISKEKDSDGNPCLRVTPVGKTKG